MKFKSPFSKHFEKVTDFNDWKGRIVVWIAAMTAGFVVVMFSKAAEYAVSFFFSWQKSNWWLPLIITPVGGAVIVGLTNKWFKGAGGSGIPQTIAALHLDSQENSYPKLINLKLAFGKILLGVSAMGVGFSTGKEGPSVQVAASVMHSFRRFLPPNFSVHPKHLILAGGAAGIAAAFNTPLAGIVFAIEELGRRFEQKTSGVIITAIVLSGLISISIQGNYTYFGHFSVGVIDKSIFLPILVSAFVCGILGGIFSLTLVESSNQLTGTLGKIRTLHPLLWAAVCGLLVALLGVISDGAAHGSGYTFAENLLTGNATTNWQYAPVKYLATIFSFLSGVPGGIFAPTLSIGVGIGNDIQPFLEYNHSASILEVLCMVGFLSAVTQAPITSFIIVMEMVDGHEMVISLMAVALLSSIISKIISPPLYATLANQQVSKAPNEENSNQL
ncbi:MAG: chloride channel protein [Methylophilaceae bacterium]